MDSAHSQKAEVERIKQAVNQNFRSRRAFRVSKVSVGLSGSAQSVNERRQDATSNSRHKSQEDLLDDNLPSIGQMQIDETQSVAAALPHVELWPLPSNMSESLNAVEVTQATVMPSNLSEAGRERVYPFSFHAGAPPAENEHELDLIMNYLDNIIPFQFYFYQPSSSERGRGWLLSLLLRAKSSYYTALAFSSLSQLMFVHKGDIMMEQKLALDLDKYHSLALSEIQAQLDLLPTLSGYDHLKLGVDILACMLQLMSIEVFRETKEYNGWKDDWEVHLQGAGRLLYVIGTDLRTSSTSSPQSTSNDDEIATNSRTNEILLPLNEIAGLDFFIKVYIWADVFRSASVGANTSDGNQFPYLPYLIDDRIRVDEIMGCRNWTMIAINEISILESWKKEMQRSRSLSVPTLARKAGEIEERLIMGLESVRKNQDDRTTSDHECNLVTEIYALAALIYLALIVSGNSHLLPEVQSCVAKTLKALKTLPPHLLIRISWAYCVAGCMAGESEKEDFSQLLYEAHEKGHRLGTLWNGMELMEEFWVLRENAEFIQTADKCAWALAMDSLGAKILLI
jgi:hypothetical protein